MHDRTKQFKDVPAIKKIYTQPAFNRVLLAKALRGLAKNYRLYIFS